MSFWFDTYSNIQIKTWDICCLDTTWNILESHGDYGDCSTQHTLDPGLLDLENLPGHPPYKHVRQRIGDKHVWRQTWRFKVVGKHRNIWPCLWYLPLPGVGKKEHEPTNLELHEAHEGWQWKRKKSSHNCMPSSCVHVHCTYAVQAASQGSVPANSCFHTAHQEGAGKSGSVKDMATRNASELYKNWIFLNLVQWYSTGLEKKC